MPKPVREGTRRFGNLAHGPCSDAAALRDLLVELVLLCTAIQQYPERAVGPGEARPGTTPAEYADLVAKGHVFEVLYRLIKKYGIEVRRD